MSLTSLANHSPAPASTTVRRSSAGVSDQRLRHADSAGFDAMGALPRGSRSSPAERTKARRLPNRFLRPVAGCATLSLFSRARPRRLPDCARREHSHQPLAARHQAAHRFRGHGVQGPHRSTGAWTTLSSAPTSCRCDRSLRLPGREVIERHSMRSSSAPSSASRRRRRTGSGAPARRVRCLGLRHAFLLVTPGLSASSQVHPSQIRTNKRD
jgi:hypothetical protein